MRFIGQLEHGLYVDNDLTIHPEVMNHYYGSRIASQQEQTHSETNLDEQDSDEEWEEVEDDEAVTSGHHADLTSWIAEEQAPQFLHEPANVPKQTNPFNHQGLEIVFKQALDKVQGLGHIPSGLGIREEEWDDEGYSKMEAILSKWWGQKELVIELPHFLWYPRAVKWCQALEVLNYTMALVD